MYLDGVRPKGQWSRHCSSRFAVIFILLSCSIVAAQQRPVRPAILVTASEKEGKPVASARVEVTSNNKVIRTATTDERGEVEFSALDPGTFEVSISKPGFEKLTETGIVVSGDGRLEVKFTLSPTIELKESVSIQAEGSNPIEQTASTSIGLQRTQLKNLPNKPATVTDALPLVPGVVRSPEGELSISGTGEHRSALVVNSADVTDPATGQFGMSVPIDSVETLNVFKTPYLAQYGRFTAGVVVVETRRGGDRWNAEINDPLPEFRIRSAHLRGIREASPRLTFNGPLISNRLYFSEGIEYDLQKRPVRTLPFPLNEKKQESINSFSQFDYILNSRHLVTATVHIAPSRMQAVNLDFFNPAPVTPAFSVHDFTGTVIDRLTLGANLLESTIAVKRFDGKVWGQGSEDMVLTPTGNRGNYFSEQNRHASRVEWLEIGALAPIQYHGAHNVKVGTTVSGTSNDGAYHARPVDVVDNAGRLLKRVEFSPGRPFDLSDLEVAAWGQDHWMVGPSLGVDIGARLEHQNITGTYRIAPRVGVAWTPFARKDTVIRGGFGLFYDRVPLNVYAFESYPERLVTTYGRRNRIIDGPRRFANVIGREVDRGFPLIYGTTDFGGFAPYGETWNVEAEDRVSKRLLLRASYLETRSKGIVIAVPATIGDLDAISFAGVGRSRYGQFEVTSRLFVNAEDQVFFSYVRSRASGDLNEFSNYLGNFPGPLVRPNASTNLPNDLPNRLLAWGTIGLPARMRISPMIEYRNGFSYSVTDAAQNYVGAPNSQRFGNFFSLDSRISKDIKISAEYSLRFSVSGFNLTNHFNPMSVHSNIADPRYGTFFESHKRRFRLDFDVIF